MALCSSSITIIKVYDGDKGNDGASPTIVETSLGSFVFPATSNGIVAPLEYSKFFCTFIVSQGSSIFNFTTGSLTNGKYSLSRVENGITNTSINSSGILIGSTSSVMLGDSASIEVTISYKNLQGIIGSFKRNIVLAKSKQGAIGKTGQYTAYQYYASTSDTTQTEGSWYSTMPSIAGGKFLWMRSQVVAAGGTISSTAWGTPVLAGSDISKLMATINTVDGKVTQNTAAITTNANAITTKANSTDVFTKEESSTAINQSAKSIQTEVSNKYLSKIEAANKFETLSTTINQTATDLNLRALKIEGDKSVTLAGLTIGSVDDNGFIQLKAANILMNGKVTAENMDISDLLKVNSLEVGQNGSLYSGCYNKDGIKINNSSGFYIGTDKSGICIIKIMGAEFGNITAANIDNPLLQTNNTQVISSDIYSLSFSSLPSLNFNVLKSLLDNDGVYNSYNKIVENTAGGTYKYIIRANSDNKLYQWSEFLSSSKKITIPHDGRYYIYSDPTHSWTDSWTEEVLVSAGYWEYPPHSAGDSAPEPIWHPPVYENVYHSESRKNYRLNITKTIGNTTTQITADGTYHLLKGTIITFSHNTSSYHSSTNGKFWFQLSENINLSGDGYYAFSGASTKNSIKINDSITFFNINNKYKWNTTRNVESDWLGIARYYKFNGYLKNNVSNTDSINLTFNPTSAIIQNVEKNEITNVYLKANSVEFPNIITFYKDFLYLPSSFSGTPITKDVGVFYGSLYPLNGESKCWGAVWN